MRLPARLSAHGLLVVACCAALAAVWVLGAPLRAPSSAGCIFGDGESYCAMARGEPGHEPFSRRPLAPLAVRLLGIGVLDGFRVVALVSAAVAAGAAASLTHRIAAGAASRDRVAASVLAAALVVAMPYGWRFASAFPAFTDLPALALGLAWLALLGRGSGAAAVLAAAVVLTREHWVVAVAAVAVWLLVRGRRREGAAHLVAAAAAVAVAWSRPSVGFDHTDLSIDLLSDPRKLAWSLAVAAAVPLAAVLALGRGARGSDAQDAGLPLLVAAAALVPLALVGGSDVPRLLAPVAALLLVASAGRLAVARRGPVAAPALVVPLLLLWRVWDEPSRHEYVAWYLPYEVPAAGPRIAADVLLAAAGAAAVAAASRVRLRSSWGTTSASASPRRGSSARRAPGRGTRS